MMETVGPTVRPSLGLLLLLLAAVTGTESPPRQLNTVGSARAARERELARLSAVFIPH